MDIKAYETLIISQLDEIFESIFESNPILNIAVQQGERQGDLISKTLENTFISAVNHSEYFTNSTTSIMGKTKSPYDIQTFFKIKGVHEKMWIDFKAFNLDNTNSNADGGTFKKVIDFINQGDFYIVYVYCFYRGKGKNQLQFEKKDGRYTKIFFLKDINDKMHIPPTNQIQVDYRLPSEYRNRTEFIDFLIEKIKESYDRRSVDSRDMLEKLESNQIRLGNYKEPKPSKVYKRESKKVKVPKIETITFEELKRLNQEQEDKIKNL